jgi:hypothetical protein
MAVEKFEGNLSQTTGQILAGWFLANPNGPTAYAVGFVELQNTRRLFLRWMHFTDGNTWLLNSLPDEQKMWGAEYGDILMNSLLLANNHFITVGGEKDFFASIPQIVVTNGNPLVAAAFFELLEIALIAADWGKEFYYVEKYGYSLFERYEEQFRDIYEKLKTDPKASKEYLEFFWDEHSSKNGFKQWQPNQYVSQTCKPVLFNRWKQMITEGNFDQFALYNFCQMWVGAHEKANWSGLATQLGDKLQPLQSFLDFFEEFNLPLLPKDIDEAFIRKKMGFS